MTAEVARKTDPVCGMSVDPAGPHQYRHAGELYYFCCARCLTRFRDDPEHFLNPPSAAEAEPVPEGARWTCPMDPEIVRDEPGDCPICGMALEPMGLAAADAGPNPELIDFTFRFWIGLALTVPLLVIAMGPMLGLPIRDWLGAAAPWAA